MRFLRIEYMVWLRVTESLYNPETSSTALVLEGVDADGWRVTLLLSLAEASVRHPVEVLAYLAAVAEVREDDA